MKFEGIRLLLLGLVIPAAATAQELSLGQCLEYAVEHNRSIQKDRLGIETAVLAKKEVVGSLLPQISASAGITDNFQKTTFAMPNFVNSMMPAAMQDPNAPKYMTVSMGMDYSANWGASVAQQIVNFSIFNALAIADESKKMADLGLQMTTDDVIAQTAQIYYAIQVLEYALDQFDFSIGLLDKTLGVVNANMENGLMREVDAGRIKVSRTNLETERASMAQALDVQKKLLKLQMGQESDSDPIICKLESDDMENMLMLASRPDFRIESIPAYRMLKEQQNMLGLQHKQAVYAFLPVVNLVGNYSMNYMGDDFKGETFYHFPVSMLSLNLKMPLFTGFSNSSKVRKAKLEIEKSHHDEAAMTQSLEMNWANASGQLEQQMRAVSAQRENKELAQKVFDVTQVNFDEGISSLSDLLNAQSQLVQSQMNYVNALSGGVKAYIDLKKASGTINELIDNK